MEKIEWPGDLAAVAEYCGDKIAFELAKTLPGITLYIPKKLMDKSSSACENAFARLNSTTQNSLISNFGGDRIYIGDLTAFRAKALAQAVLDMSEAGTTIHNIALTLGISEQRVYQIRACPQGKQVIARSKIDPRQLTLKLD